MHASVFVQQTSVRALQSVKGMQCLSIRVLSPPTLPRACWLFRCYYPAIILLSLTGLLMPSLCGRSVCFRPGLVAADGSRCSAGSMAPMASDGHAASYCLPSPNLTPMESAASDGSNSQ